MKSSQRIAEYYAGFNEWGRLESPTGRLEFERTLAYILDTLEERSDVLDLGGGPGRYTLALAREDHTVSLVDLSAELVDQARNHVAKADLASRIPLVAQGRAEDLSEHESNSFDAVLALGPFYHLIEKSRRVRAAEEVMRVLRPGGVAFVAFIPRASGIAGLILRAAADPAQVTPAALEKVVAEGVFLNATSRGFQDGYYPEVDEIETLFEDVGLTQVDLFSIRSLYLGAEKEAAEVRERAPDTAAIFEQALEKLSRDRSLIALGGHALLVLRKPNADRSS